jgi:DNA invertase Pin-like site-specific DNA recombinase
LQDTCGACMGKLIGYARVSTGAQDTGRQIRDLLAAV